MNCGREVDVMDLDITRTYGGLLEGTPYKRLNALMIDRWKYPRTDSDRSKKVNLQIIPRRVEDKIDMRSRETSFLPPVYMTMWLESDPFVESEACSAMKVIYFCDYSDFLNLDLAIQNVIAEIDWNDFAVDCMP